ncbi:hypothetical protein Csa_008813 [Cucumis sativus]|uniref:Uncharacterized protein n=1 Tax=Cucumis sativus TaxID=3659 RepID=A0A0A0KVV3_CUCSA|nr:hypothetical protein Csa_008813 [Cucumis sativus]
MESKTGQKLSVAARGNGQRPNCRSCQLTVARGAKSEWTKHLGQIESREIGHERGDDMAPQGC